MKKHFHFLLFAVFLVITFSRCSPEKTKPVVLVAEPEFVNEEVVELIRKQLSNFDTLETLFIADDSLFATKLIVEFYKINKFNVTWSDKGKHSKQSDSLLSLIKNSDDYGLISSDYHFSKIESLIKKERDSKTKKYDAVKISEVDMLLTDAFFTFAAHVNKGRLNIDSLVREWKIARFILPRTIGESEIETDLVAVLNDAIKQNNIHYAIDSLEPKNRQYQALKSALKNFKFEFRDSEWDSLATRESDSTGFNERLKKRLVASHDYAELIEYSDSIKLVKAIKNFQCRHNLTEDGKIGKLTFKALQRSKRDYVHQIQMNMERWRYYYSPYEKQFVWVNVPKYEMRVIEEDTLVMKSNVIVGQPDHKTPILKSTIRYFLIYPYWTVPLSIATKEILPILKRDTSYLRRKNFEVLDYRNRVVETPINWKKYNKNYFPFKLRQRTGDENSLGILKFNFENKYGVYLHDTDNRRLFKREMRAMSHGCVRLERFIDFAKFLIRDDKKNYPLDSLKMDLLKEEQKYVYIKHPIPIYINYFTTEVDDNDELFFFIDVYKKDEKMLKSLYYLR
ncbi:MAG: L,D-transpeptidase family protein [Bacteroidota bacterium]